MSHNKVKMTFDGRTIALYVDTGSRQTYLVYGGWYESVYGPGSCEYLVSGCYFCPLDDPCDLKGLLSQRIRTISYGDKDVVKFVNRRVALEYDEQKIRNLQIGLVVNATMIKKNQPHAVLGVSFNPRVQNAVQEPSFLEHLLRFNNPTASIHVSKFSIGLTGRLVLGRSPEHVRGTRFFPIQEAPWAATMSAMVASAAWVKSSSDAAHGKQLWGEGGHFHVVLDTGSDTSTIPSEVFSMILDTIEAEFGEERIDWTGEFYKGKKRNLVAFLDGHRRIWCRKTMVNRLPSIDIQVDGSPAFEINLSDYAFVCGDLWCTVQIKDRLSLDDSESAFLLGMPFFAAHDFFIDHGSRLIGIKAPAEPVVKESFTTKAWNERLGPPCTRVVQIPSGATRVIQSCIDA